MAGIDVGERMTHRQHERHARFEDPVDLTQESTEIVDVTNGVRRKHDLTRCRRDVAEVGEVGFDALHGDFGVGRSPARLCDALGVGIDGDGLRSGACEVDGVEPWRDAQLDGPPAVTDVTAQAQLLVVWRIGPEIDVGNHPPSVPDGVGLDGDHAVRRDVERVVSRAMAFTVGALRGSDGSRGLIDHRLARRMLIAQVKKGRVPLDQVCDAHPELIRAARNVGTQTTMRCPICEEADLKLVTYVFGPRLSAQGRCVSTAKEMRQLNDRREDLSAYVVEACVECRWNHLLRIIPVGGRA